MEKSAKEQGSEVVRRQRDNTERSRVIVKSGIWFIVTNFLLSVFNMIVGTIAGSVAIVGDGAHSLIDAVSGFLIIGSEKLAESAKFAEKRAKIERVTTIIIALIIIAVGVHILVEAIEKLLEPEEMEISAATIVVVAASLVAKLILAIYLIQTGKKQKSEVVRASGAETLNDMWISAVVLLSIVVYAIWHVDIEGYVSAIIAFVIFKVGLEFIFPHLDQHHHHPFEIDADHDHCGKE